MTANSDRFIGSKIEYEFKKDVLQEGIVMDKIQMLHQDKVLNTTSTVTGYLILDPNNGKVTPITYWRITKFIA